MKNTPGRLAFNIVAGVDLKSDDFEFLTPEMQSRWERAANAAEEFKKHNCTKCGHDWLDHEFGVPAPSCP